MKQRAQSAIKKKTDKPIRTLVAFLLITFFTQELLCAEQHNVIVNDNEAPEFKEGDLGGIGLGQELPMQGPATLDRALSEAVAHGELGHVRYLLQTGLTAQFINYAPPHRSTPLHTCAQLHETDEHGELVPLSLEKQHVMAEIASVLLYYGAYPDVISHGWTPLMDAVANGYLELVELLKH